MVHAAQRPSGKSNCLRPENPLDEARAVHNVRSMSVTAVVEWGMLK
jgi:hypothetical protein